MPCTCDPSPSSSSSLTPPLHSSHSHLCWQHGSLHVVLALHKASPGDGPRPPLLPRHYASSKPLQSEPHYSLEVACRGLACVRTGQDTHTHTHGDRGRERNEERERNTQINTHTNRLTCTHRHPYLHMHTTVSPSNLYSSLPPTPPPPRLPPLTQELTVLLVSTDIRTYMCRWVML